MWYVVVCAECTAGEGWGGPGAQLNRAGRGTAEGSLEGWDVGEGQDHSFSTFRA